MTRARWVSSLLGAAVVSAAGAAQAQSSFIANLTPGQETAAPAFTSSSGGARPISSGFATLTLTPLGLQMTATVFDIDVNGLQTPNDANDNLGAAHIHCCTASNPGANAGVRWGFFGLPFHDTLVPQLELVPLVGGVGGVFTSTWNFAEGAGAGLSDWLAGIRAGQAYLNFHTAQNPGGEIRGAILATPEPSTYALMATGLLALGGVARRRRA